MGIVGKIKNIMEKERAYQRMIRLQKEKEMELAQELEEIEDPEEKKEVKKKVPKKNK